MKKTKAEADKTVRDRVALKTRKGGTTIIPTPSTPHKTKVEEAKNEADKT